MNLFSLYPKVNYSINDYDKLRVIDITTSLKIKNFFKEYTGISYTPYFVQDGERPDNVSQRFYQDPNYDWIVMLVNDRYSIYDDWPKDQETFKRYIIEKYGSISTASSTIKYYYDADKDIIDATTYASLSVSQRSTESVFEYEQRINLNKALIKIISPTNIGAVQYELKSLLVQPIR